MLLRLARRRLALPAFCSHRPHSTATPRNARHDDAEWATRRSVSDYRQRFRVRESAARKNVDDTVAQWLALSRTEQPLTSDRALGYRPHDRLSGYHEMWDEREDVAAVVEAVRRAETGDQWTRPWAAWAMALRCRHGRGVRACQASALDHARAAADGGLADAQAALGCWLLSPAADADAQAEGLRWLSAAADAGHEVARFSLENHQAGGWCHWWPTAPQDTGSEQMEWGRARYNDGGLEGWGRLPLSDLLRTDDAAVDAPRLRALAAEHALLPPGNSDSAGAWGSPRSARADEELLWRCRAQLSPRFVITLHESPLISDLRYAQRLGEWAYRRVGAALVRRERQLRLGVAAQLAESLWQAQLRAYVSPSFFCAQGSASVCNIRKQAWLGAVSGGSRVRRPCTRRRTRWPCRAASGLTGPSSTSPPSSPPLTTPTRPHNRLWQTTRSSRAGLSCGIGWRRRGSRRGRGGWETGCAW